MRLITPAVDFFRLKEVTCINLGDQEKIPFDVWVAVCFCRDNGPYYQGTTLSKCRLSWLVDPRGLEERAPTYLFFVDDRYIYKMFRKEHIWCLQRREIFINPSMHLVEEIVLKPSLIISEMIEVGRSCKFHDPNKEVIFETGKVTGILIVSTKAGQFDFHYVYLCQGFKFVSYLPSMR